MNKFFKITVCFFLMLPYLGIDAQKQVVFESIKSDYIDADEFFRAEDYKEALFLFSKVIEQGYISYNLQFKIGICYLNIPGKETKAIPYLEEASKHTSVKYKRSSLEERNAPLETLFYLGNAYRIANKLDLALKAYSRFVNNPAIENYNSEIIDNEIQACEIAKTIQDKPVDISFIEIPVNFIEDVTYSTISANDSVLVYLGALKFYNAVFVCYKNNDKWGEPININGAILSDGDFYPTCLSANGKQLFLIRKVKNNFDLYISDYFNGQWTPAKPLNKNINSQKNENYACLSSDGQTLYFSSDRRESKGGYDIFYSKRGADMEWGPAINMGKGINTKTDEVAPSISVDGNTMYFSSKGHYNMGGFDVFYSQKLDNIWIDPKNIGFPVNTTNDNIGFYLTKDRKIAIMSRITETGTYRPYLLQFPKMPGQ